jgi:hypothetical protein
MGAGCYYTHKETGTKACWIVLPVYDAENGDGLDEQEWNETEWDFITEDLDGMMDTLGYYKQDRLTYRNGLVEVTFESTYYGDGIVVLIEPIYVGNYYDCKLYNLAITNHTRIENRILKAIHKCGYKLRYATSGYTSAEYTPN